MSRLSSALLCAWMLLAASAADATVILDTGLATFAPTGTQFGRITRDGITSIWGSAKLFPGVTSAPVSTG